MLRDVFGGVYLPQGIVVVAFRSAIDRALSSRKSLLPFKPPNCLAKMEGSAGLTDVRVK